MCLFIQQSSPSPLCLWRSYEKATEKLRMDRFALVQTERKGYIPFIHMREKCAPFEVLVFHMLTAMVSANKRDILKSILY